MKTSYAKVNEMTISLAERSTRAHAFLLEVKFDLLMRLRQKTFSLTAIGFPVLFYLVFGVALRHGETGAGSATYLLATYGCFGVVGIALSNFGVSVALERGYGWSAMKASSPMPPFLFLLARLCTCAVFGFITIVVLMVLGVLLGGVRLSLGDAVWFMLTLLLGMIPFCSMGMLIGFSVPPNAAGGITNLIYLPMSLVSGLWFPIELMPALVRMIAQWTPTYHFAQLALSVAHAPNDGRHLLHWCVLAVCTFGFQFAASMLLRNKPYWQSTQ